MTLRPLLCFVAGTYVTKYQNGLFAFSAGGDSVSYNGISITGCQVVPTGLIAVIVIPIVAAIIGCCLCCFFCKGCPGHTRRQARLLAASGTGGAAVGPQQPGAVYMVPQPPQPQIVVVQQPPPPMQPISVSPAPKAAAPAPAALQTASSTPEPLLALLQRLGMGHRLGALSALGLASVEDLGYLDVADLDKAGLSKVEARKLMDAAAQRKT